VLEPPPVTIMLPDWDCACTEAMPDARKMDATTSAARNKADEMVENAFMAGLPFSSGSNHLQMLALRWLLHTSCFRL